MRLMEITCIQIPVHYFGNAGANGGYLLISFRPSALCGRLKVSERPPVCVCVCVSVREAKENAYRRVWAGSVGSS